MIRAKIPLPPAFGQTTDVRIETVAVTIRPRFPRPAKEYEGTVTEVDFTWTEEGRQPVWARTSTKSSTAIRSSFRRCNQANTGCACALLVQRLAPGKRLRSPKRRSGSSLR
jgi:hypothetical protein